MTDLLGRTLTSTEAGLLTAYQQLNALLLDELPPVAAANIRHALAQLDQAVTSLALGYDPAREFQR